MRTRTALTTLIVSILLFEPVWPLQAKTHRSPRKKTTAAAHSPSPSPTPKKKAAAASSPSPSPSPSPTPEPSPESTPVSKKKAAAAPNASIETSDLKEFASQPAPVRELIETSLALARRNLTYTYGSADPANGGMDCSGFIYYVLHESGFEEVPRDASGQYVWARKNGKFISVISRKKTSFELNRLLPGDLLFWTGTYNTDRDPPITHTMVYLGTEKSTGTQVMIGSSDGRVYHGKSRWGVSVFDFTLPKKSASDAPQSTFVGYARIPGLREPLRDGGL